MVPTRTAEDVGYFNWLCKQVRVPHENDTYDALMIQLYETEFVWVIGNDDNRLSDARDLRLRYNGKPVSSERGVTFLEVLIALSKRFAFLVERNPKDLAWELLSNLKLDRYPDPINAAEWKQIRDILEAVIWRTYHPDGTGGFFPLTNPQDDQTNVEIWYQMAAYIKERHESFDL